MEAEFMTFSKAIKRKYITNRFFLDRNNFPLRFAVSLSTVPGQALLLQIVHKNIFEMKIKEFAIEINLNELVNDFTKEMS